MDLLPAIIELFTQPWVWLVVLASIFYAAGNYIDELLLSDYEQEVGVLVLISTTFGLLIASAFFGLAFWFDSELLIDSTILVQAMAVGVLEALWIIPYLYATERSGAVIAGPLFQAVPVFALVIEGMFGIIPPPMQIVGAIILVGGGIILAIETDVDETGHTSRSVNWGTIGLMAIAAIIVSLIYVLFKDAAVATNFFAIGFWTGVGMFLTGLVIYTVWKPYRDQFNTFLAHTNYRAVGLQGFNEVLDASGVYMTNLANTLGPSVLLVTAFNATQPIAVGILGFLLSAFGIAKTSSGRMQNGGWKLLFFGISLIAIGIVVLAIFGEYG